MIGDMRQIFGRTCWCLRMHYWLWREKQMLAKLQSLGVVLGVDRPVPCQGIPESPSLGEPTVVTELAEQFRLQPFLLGDDGISSKRCAVSRPRMTG